MSDLVTVAEASGYHRTARHAEVVTLLDELARRSPLARRASMGSTHEGREIPLLVLADPPLGDAAAARAASDDGRVVVLVFANIHAGEVCGKEALPMLARELLAAPDDPTFAAWLQRLVIVFAPIFNADGNERMAPDNRPGQDGPDEMGTRANAQGLDLNRDYMKLESPEVRAMVRFLQEWDPALVVDLHTTNGSLHRYDLTWSPPLNPAGPAAPLALVRDRLLPDVSERLTARAGIHTYPYGNFEGDHERWCTYSSLPRFGAQYHGLRGQLSVLSEAYSKVSFERRVVATREFVREILDWTAGHADDVRRALREGREQTIAAGRAPSPRDQVGIRHELAVAPRPATLAGWVEVPGDDGHPRSTGEPRDYVVQHFDHFEPVLTVERPLAYLVPASETALLDVLARHGIAMHALVDAPAVGDAAGDATAASAGVPRSLRLAVEVYHLDAVTSGSDAYLGHGTPDVSATPRREERAFSAADGYVVVPTAQALGTLVVHLLEPEAEDALAPVLLGDRLRAGTDFAVLRVVDAAPGSFRPR